MSDAKIESIKTTKSDVFSISKKSKKQNRSKRSRKSKKVLPQSQNDSPKQISLTAHTSKLMRKNKERQREVAQVVLSLSIFSEEKQVAPLSTPLKIKKSFHSE